MGKSRCTSRSLSPWLIYQAVIRPNRRDVPFVAGRASRVSDPAE